MCSNTSFSSGGGGGCVGDNGGYDGDSIYSKKPKKQRVPKRGPGVAELEKILREQEKKNDPDKTKNDGFFLVSPISNPYQTQSPNILPSSNSLPKNVPFAPDPRHFSPPATTTAYGNGASNTSLGGGKSSVQIGGSGIALTDQHALVPSMWNSGEANVDIEGPRSSNGLPFLRRSSNGPNQMFPSPALMQRSQYSSPPSIVNLCPHSVVSSSPTPSSAGLCHGIEPPSNQTSYHHYTSVWPEEDKMVGTKRSRPFSMEIPPTPPFRYQVPTFSPQMNRPDSSFSCGSNTIINLEPSGAVSRDMKMGSPLELKFKKYNTDYGSQDGNFLLFGSPAIPSPSTPISQQERSSFSTNSLQESMDDSPHRPGTGRSIHKKPFYSFLLPLEQMGKVDTSFTLSNERVETRGDGIDLSLRL